MVFYRSFYKTKAKQKVQVSNSGECIVEFEFVPPEGRESDKIGKRWLSVRPKSGLILTDQTIEISFTLFIDEKSA